MCLSGHWNWGLTVLYTERSFVWILHRNFQKFGSWDEANNVWNMNLAWHLPCPFQWTKALFHHCQQSKDVNLALTLHTPKMFLDGCDVTLILFGLYLALLCRSFSNLLLRISCFRRWNRVVLNARMHNDWLQILMFMFM